MYIILPLLTLAHFPPNGLNVEKVRLSDIGDCLSVDLVWFYPLDIVQIGSHIR